MKKHNKLLYKLLYSASLLIIIIFITKQYARDTQENIISNFHKRSPYTITFFIEAKKTTKQDLSYKELQEKIRKPGKLARTLYKRNLQNTLNQGIYTSYAGFCTPSNHTGRVTFPRKTQEADFYFVVTQKIKPVFLHGKTINHFVSNKNTNTALYHIEQKHDAKQKIDFWQITPEQIPANRRIPRNAIIIHAKPKHIFIPRRSIISSSRQNLLLPTIYTTKFITPGVNALTFLKTNKYFAPVRFSYKKTPMRYASMILD